MLSFPYDCYKFLRNEVERAYPEEACGIMLGRREELDDKVVRVIACPNMDSEPRRRYAIEPGELITAQRLGREKGLEILGFYHSHPDHPAEPSVTDLREAHWTGCVYLICGVNSGSLVEVAAMRLTGQAHWAAEQVHFAPPAAEG